MADLILKQSGYSGGSVDVEGLARALGILVIERKPLKSLDGILLTQPERTDGAILINEGNYALRQRFSIAHELGHFLNPHHRPTTPEGFACSGHEHALAHADWQKHRQQEREADAFASALLMPRTVIEELVDRGADLAKLVARAAFLEVSKQAMVRRWLEITPFASAMVAHRDDRIAWIDRSRSCPPFDRSRGHRIGELPGPEMSSGTTHQALVSGESWGLGEHASEVVAQTHFQMEERGITILTLL